MKKTRQKHRDFFAMLGSTMSPASVARAESKARKMLLDLRLAELRRQAGLTQDEVKGFSQPDVSKIESRQDIKLSTLVEFCKGLGAGVTITAHPTRKGRILKSVVLLSSP